jgi:hypothetical protein
MLAERADARTRITQYEIGHRWIEAEKLLNGFVKRKSRVQIPEAALSRPNESPRTAVRGLYLLLYTRHELDRIEINQGIEDSPPRAEGEALLAGRQEDLADLSQLAASRFSIEIVLRPRWALSPLDRFTLAAASAGTGYCIGRPRRRLISRMRR